MKKRIFSICIIIVLLGGLFYLCKDKWLTPKPGNLPPFSDNYNASTTQFYCNDTKRFTQNENDAEFVNYSKGYALHLPKEVQFDFSLSPLFVDVLHNDFSLRVSKEWSPYDDVKEYIDYYLNRFLHSETWRSENRVTCELSQTTEAKNASSFVIDREDYHVQDLTNGEFDRYTYLIIRNQDRNFFCLTFKYHAEKAAEMDAVITAAMDSFTVMAPKGEDTFSVDYHPVLPDNWTDETKAVYQKLTNENTELMWGIFTRDIYGEGIDTTIPNLEKELDYEFPVVLSYIHFIHDFPMEFMQKNWENGKIVELTYQMTSTNNEKLMGYTPNIDIYRGVKDEEIRKLARSAKEFGHPFLFRINNEMNSDWTSYGGVVNLRDPQLFISNWQRFYRIFQEEGVNNVIWVFNPNDRNYPPCDWNNSLAYYPGNEYVQVIGITGYNTGTYYEKEMGETWREFEDIYDAIYEEYEPLFGSFPWMITEFASSSVGGDKVQWINRMFQCIGKYKNLKIAVWFDLADYDFREENLSKVARPYFLAETPETLNAFKNGLKNYTGGKWN